MLAIRLFVAALWRFQVGQNPTHHCNQCNISRVCSPAKMALKTLERSIVAQRETSQQTAHLCLKVVAALGARGRIFQSVTSTLHIGVPSRLASNRPNAII